MQYVNFVYESGDEPTLHTGPVPESDAAYLRSAITHLKPLSDEDYMTGPAGILNTPAKTSYVLDGDDLYWCKEVQTQFENALARVDALADAMQPRYAGDRKGWLELCRQNLAEWSGEGVRLKPAG